MIILLVFFASLQIHLSDLRRLPYYLPYYKYAFAKHWDAQQVKAEAYSWRKYREQTLTEPSESSESNEPVNGKTINNPKISQSSTA